MEASQSVKADVNAADVSTERSRRPPRRAAMIARENVNLLRGKEPTAAELRENSGYEKQPGKSQSETTRKVQSILFISSNSCISELPD